jgi:polysaccharide deacetylase 2 family uncharacterized protein YibQ
MDKKKVATELLTLAKTLVAGNRYVILDASVGKASVALADLVQDVLRDRAITDKKVKKDILESLQDAIEAMDKAGEAILDYEAVNP